MLNHRENFLPWVKNSIRTFQYLIDMPILIINKIVTYALLIFFLTTTASFILTLAIPTAISVISFYLAQELDYLAPQLFLCLTGAVFAIPLALSTMAIITIAVTIAIINLAVTAILSLARAAIGAVGAVVGGISFLFFGWFITPHKFHPRIAELFHFLTPINSSSLPINNAKANEFINFFTNLQSDIYNWPTPEFNTESDYEGPSVNSHRDTHCVLYPDY